MLSLLRTILATLAGFLAMMVAVIVLTLVSIKVLHLQSGHPTPAYLVFNLVYSLAAAVLGGWIAGSLARPHTLRSGYLLALIIFAFGLYSYRHYTGTQPTWYQAVIVILPPLCAILGAALLKTSPAQLQPTPSTMA